ncbi:hypothetical protein PVK06_030461 [Gossypium arboreum]|uniref:Uncharacterized protein n=1 Tax=Gossypium arboreum TaxID=29729 RepID=A0ABR0NQW2_GOSAR|nr:hypothetical protein PVK06_030461 [Gossypium arboreum]
MYQSTMGALAQEHYANLAKENMRLLEQNRRLEGRLTITEKDVERLHGVIAKVMDLKDMVKTLYAQVVTDDLSVLYCTCCI